MALSVTIACPNCARDLRVSEGDFGARKRCRHCAGTLRVPRHSRVACPSCGREGGVRHEHLGRGVRCPRCLTAFRARKSAIDESSARKSAVELREAREALATLRGRLERVELDYEAKLREKDHNISLLRAMIGELQKERRRLTRRLLKLQQGGGEPGAAEGASEMEGADER